MGVSTEWASDRLKQVINLSINAVCERLMERDPWSRSMAIPSANFTGPRSDISHLECSSALKWLFSYGRFVML